MTNKIFLCHALKFEAWGDNQPIEILEFSGGTNNDFGKDTSNNQTYSEITKDNLRQGNSTN